MADFNYSVDADGVATITWDLPGKSMNVLSMEGMRELDTHIDTALADDAVKGVIITSAKKDFAGGMDLNVIAKMKESAGDNPAQGLFDGIMSMHHGLRKIERAGMDPKTLKGGKPIVAALPGIAWASGWRSRWPVTASSPPTIRRPRLACLRSWSASSLARVAPPGLCARWARWRRPPPSCWKARPSARTRPRPQV